MSAPRTGSMATKATSQALDLTASTTLPAAAKVTSSTETPNRRASSRDRSTDTPRGSPVTGSLVARTGLPKLIAARNVPDGASSATVAAKGCVVIGGVEHATIDNAPMHAIVVRKQAMSTRRHMATL